MSDKVKFKFKDDWMAHLIKSDTLTIAGTKQRTTHYKNGMAEKTVYYATPENGLPEDIVAVNPLFENKSNS
jgi:hypothetical protein